MAFSFPLKIVFSLGVLCTYVITEINSQNAEYTLTPSEIEILLRPLLALPGQRTLQAEALRQQLINLIEEGLDEVGPDDDALKKRNLQSLARSGYLRGIGGDASENELLDEAKRGISSLARNGDLHHSKREEIEDLLDELYDKRNIGSLARSYSLPSNGKRFLGSVARNGDLIRFENGKRNIASIMRNGKRNIASLVRNNNLPIAYDEYKRNIASLARNGGKFLDKRNVAALLRQDNYLNQIHQNEDSADNSQTEKPDENNENTNDKTKGDSLKRSLASVKAGYKPKYKRSLSLRNKRQVDYYDDQNEEYPQPVYQKQNAMDYEDFLHALSEFYPSTEKRFLGRLPQMGKPKTTPPPKVMKRRISGFY